MKSKSILAALLAGGVIIAPVTAMGGTRASDNEPVGTAAAGGTSADVLRLCGKIAATNSGVTDEACHADLITHEREDVDRLCSLIDANDLDVTDAECTDEAGALAGAGGTAGAAGGAGLGGGLAGAGLIIPTAGAAAGSGIIAASSSSSVSRGAN